MRLLSTSKAMRQPSLVEPYLSMSFSSRVSNALPSSWSNSYKDTCPFPLTSNSSQSFDTALTPSLRQAFAKSAWVTIPLWSASRVCRQAAKRLPCFTMSMFLKCSMVLITMSRLWSSARRVSMRALGDANCCVPSSPTRSGDSAVPGRDPGTLFPDFAVFLPSSPAHTVICSAGGTPINNTSRSACSTTRCPWRLIIILNNLRLAVSVKPCLTAADLKSSKLRKPAECKSSPSLQAFSKQPNLSTKRFLAASRASWASGSMFR
mmetsp:Transcript_17684/g.41080  ORF Transcript_17684/g.41080 Transcript_17684/m.41080 type:complete len:263 (-) Transcript_17684:2837-3625(-)